jgi:ethanolamine permease
MSELASAVPFSGGSYGFVRVTMGRFAGLTVGVCEAIDYTFYVAATALSLGAAVTNMSGLSPHLETLWMFLFYSFACVLHIRGGKFYWQLMIGYAVLQSALLFVFYFLCFSIPGFSFANNAPIEITSAAAVAPLAQNGTANGALANGTALVETSESVYFLGGVQGFFQIVPLAMWWFIGIEMAPLAAEETREPRKNVPKGMMTAVCTLIAHAFCTLFVCLSVPPGTDKLAGEGYPLNQGFAALWPGAADADSANGAWWTTFYSMPAIFSTFYGFMFGYGSTLAAAATASWRTSQRPLLCADLALCVAFVCQAVKCSRLLVRVWCPRAWVAPATAMALLGCPSSYFPRSASSAACACASCLQTTRNTQWAPPFF